MTGPETLLPAETEGTRESTPSSPFHEGEQHVQTRLGVRDAIEPWARRVVRPYLPEEHRAFYDELPFLILAGSDLEGRPWATMVAEDPGFASSPDARSLHLSAGLPSGDALEASLRAGDDVGILGIELETRRRNRVNGRVQQGGAEGLKIEVTQAFGNCPQYITERRWSRAPANSRPGRVTRRSELSAAQIAQIRSSDTFFIATGHRGEGDSEAFGMDASHRGGSPGFVRVSSANELVFPDYAGNNHFNTIGNLLMDPRAGLLFVDFERGDLLQLTGRTRIDWDSPEVERISGARRLVHFEVDEVVSLPSALPLRWETTGDSVRELRVVDKRPESVDVTSFLLAPRDGSAPAEFEAGQHLPIELEVPGEEERVRRTYSLSGAPGDDFYRITVKREELGLASRFLHDSLEVGGFLSASRPQGSFVLDHSSERPVVLVSAGVGLTPMVSMLHSLVRNESARPVWFVHGARDGGHHPLQREVEQLIASAASARLHVAYSRPQTEDVAGRRYHSVGRVDGALLEKLVPALDADFYLCGPVSFMASVEAELDQRGVAVGRIHSESFGPAA